MPGAQFVKCALQVNPWAYLVTNNKPQPFDNEDEYNAAMVQRCIHEKVNVVALTDHHRVRESLRLAAALETAGITVLPGFEATSQDGVHVLMIFPEGTDEDTVNGRISQTGMESVTDGSSAPGTLSLAQLLDKAVEWGALAIPAHVETTNGLLTKLSGDERMVAWQCPSLLCVGVTKPFQDIEQGKADILACAPAEYKRVPPAIVMARDVIHPDQLAGLGSWSWLKMTTPGFEGVYQAFLDPDSRIILPPGAPLPAGARIVAVSWTGGFLNGETVRLNSGLNTLIGGRGTGKSTVIESIRYALDAEHWTDDERSGLINRALGPGTVVTIELRCTTPRDAKYLITRSVGGQPEVADASGQAVALRPRDLIPDLQVFGQRDLAALADDSSRRDLLITRFMDANPEADQRLEKIAVQLGENRIKLSDLIDKRNKFLVQVEEIPSIEAKVGQIEDAGIDERVTTKDLLAGDGRTLTRAAKEITDSTSAIADFRSATPNDLAYLAVPAREGRAATDLLEQAETALTDLVTAMGAAASTAEHRAAETAAKVAALIDELRTREHAVDEDYQAALRELAESGVDAGDYVQLKARLDELQAAKREVATLSDDADALRSRRGQLLDERAELLDDRRRRKKEATAQMRERLNRHADVISRAGQERSAVKAVIASIFGRTKELEEAVTSANGFDVVEFAAAARAGADALQQLLPDVTRSQAERLSGCSDEVFMRIEEAVPSDVVEVKLNLTPDAGAPRWVDVEHLSTGQQATAMLLVTLLEGEAPLIIDQPEDDLDNQFISESLVPMVRKAKDDRQLVFSSHNANIPVLGDADLVVVMRAEGSAVSDGHGWPDPNAMGSIDDVSVRLQIEKILEGGRDAFERRRRRYGY